MGLEDREYMRRETEKSASPIPSRRSRKSRTVLAILGITVLVAVVFIAGRHPEFARSLRTITTEGNGGHDAASPSEELPIEVSVVDQMFGPVIDVLMTGSGELTIRKILVNGELDVGPLMKSAGWPWEEKQLPVTLSIGETYHTSLPDYAKIVVVIRLDTSRGSYSFRFSH
jgi:hypothetical protein